MPLKVEIKFSWDKSPQDLVDEKLFRQGETLIFMASTWHKLYTPFIPRETGFLALDSVDIYQEGDSGIIHHKASYAHYQYEGLKADGTKFNYSTEVHPLATNKWDEAAKAAGKGEELVRAVEAYLTRGK